MTESAPPMSSPATPERRSRLADAWRRGLVDYGMLGVLILLCVLFSVLTWSEQFPEGEVAARQVAGEILSGSAKGQRVLIAARAQDGAFVETLKSRLGAGGLSVE